MADIGASRSAIKNLVLRYYDYDRRVADAKALTDGFGLANTNALAHAYLSAWITIDHGRIQARMLGDGRERWEPGPDWDTFKDLWNNKVGRRIGEYVKHNNLPPDVVPSLVSDALARGDLIVTRTDPRIPADWSGTKVGVKAPSDFNADPPWRQPSGSWGPPPGFKPVPVPPPPPWSDPISGLIYSDATHASPRQPQGIAGRAIGSSPGSAPGQAADPGIQTDKASAATAPATDDTAAAPRQEFSPPRPDFYGDPRADERASNADRAVRNDTENSRQEQATDRAAGYQPEAVAAHLARIDEAKQRIPDFDRVIRSGGQVPIAPGVADEILNSEKSALLQYHLAGNPNKLAELNGLSGMNLAREIGRLESGLHLPAAKTEASPPLSDVRGGAAPVFDPVTTDDMDAFANWLREDQARRRRA